LLSIHSVVPRRSYDSGTSTAARELSIRQTMEAIMPLIPIVLWAGIPIIVIGGGVWIAHVSHWF